MASSAITVGEQPIFTRRKLRVAAIGAGFASLTLAYKHKYVGDNSYTVLTIYEKNPEIGGTWFENKHTGVACDVPAHIYCFPFAPKPDWSAFYVGGAEILEYIQRTVDRFDLRGYVQVSSRVTSATWSEDKGKWQLEIERGGESIRDEFDVLINGSGFLNNWKWPDIPELESFRGEIVHSASWQTVDWKNKRVALIGNGSPAIQILPELQRTAKSIDTYIRTPTWIIPNFLADMTPEGKNFAYSDDEK
ncbi:Putative flavin monooxygenase, FAD/NAD(P)-binding domain superfamily [Septoria linicola]|uniref:Flavin monooxygenase, FAD/NAD(P)-binding domain superfamily n=1 Tax=Septoria linicola TaxID=215465 RepID=A0A9Q9APJ0_9PEZI|nr:putative flavin monooxygenase, FAD/NAD(P)-binding domain superfamily [Septoria linicola]USW50215.1 Putative flavin monooxygenase, FAD/NAD(P)-binding domain superfamily [Septoria linicola]